MRTASLLAFGAVASGLVAQSNIVAGLDGRLTVVDNLTYYGRRGAAHPNGEAGMAMLNTMCNPGSVDIPWFAAMQPDHPMFGFLIVRVANDRLEQINEWSFCKHAFTSINVNGSCGSCQDPGTGSLMGINCSDTYGASNNASRFWLGPPNEINPWLGTWDPVGSYFDIGDPSQAGYPNAADGVRSLNSNIFDSVQNRVTVKEQDLLTPGADYYYALQLLHEGEALANRGDNLAHRGMTPSWNGSTWSFSNNSAGQDYGSVLDRWPGATVESGHNGNDDGRFFVASKVTVLGGGQYHYEYAVHNVDNSRGGAELRIPIDASASASNFTFGDIDSNSANDWTAQRVGNEIVFQAGVGSQPLEWNTIYNFGFDADFAPGQSGCDIVEARPGPGAMMVTVATQAPAGSTFATVSSVGTGCGGSPVQCDAAFYEEPGFDLGNSAFTLTYDASGDSYTLDAGQGSWIAPTGATNLNLGDDDQSTRTLSHTLPFPGGSTGSLNICSNGFVSESSNGTAYDPSVGSFLGGATRWAGLWHDLSPNQGGDVFFTSNAQRTVVTWDAVENFSGSLTATFQMQFWANGDVHVLYQNVGVGGNEYLVGFSIGGGVANPGGIDISNSLNGSVTICAGVPVPDLELTASARPIIGTSIDLVTSNVPLTSVGGLSILSLSPISGGLDLTFLGMPGCFLYQQLDVIDVIPVAGGSGQRSFAFPNDPSLSGVVLYNQGAALVANINPFNIVTSNGLALLVGLN
ncbi:MAG: hypothetical protein AB8H80_03335 [Planctomycetota bacterium]